MRLRLRAKAPPAKPAQAKDSDDGGDVVAGADAAATASERRLPAKGIGLGALRGLNLPPTIATKKRMRASTSRRGTPSTRIAPAKPSRAVWKRSAATTTTAAS